MYDPTHLRPIPRISTTSLLCRKLFDRVYKDHYSVTGMIKIYQWSKTTARDKERIMSRSQADMESIKPYVSGIIKDVRSRGDQAIVKYTRKFDNPRFTAGMIRVGAADIKKAYRMTDPKVLRTMREQIKISSTYAKTERAKLVADWKIETTKGVTTGSRLTPLQSLGPSVPAGG